MYSLTNVFFQNCLQNQRQEINANHIFVKEQLGNHHKHEDRTLSIKVRSIDEEEVAAAVPEEQIQDSHIRADVKKMY